MDRPYPSPGERRTISSKLRCLFRAFVAPTAEKKWPGNFICQKSVLLEVTKTCETARAFQPKPKQGEGSGKEKRLFLEVLLSFASEFGLTC